MKIIVRSQEHRICLPIPTSFLLSRTMVKLWLWGMRRSQEYVDIPEQVENAFWDLPTESVLRLCDELRRIKRKHGSWDLVEVETASGDHVLIQL